MHLNMVKVCYGIGGLLCVEYPAAYNTPYKFSAKEKDEETGYSYFGARYLNSDYSFWLSVGPKSDKYPYQ